MAQLKAGEIARICHEAMRAHEIVTSGATVPEWDLLPKVVQLACIARVQFVLDDLKVSPHGFYNYGRTDGKSFDSLPFKIQERVFLFIAIVRAMRGWRPEGAKNE